MSFMFNPTDYADPKAVNYIDDSDIQLELARFGNAETAAAILASGAKTIGIDGYTTASFTVLCDQLKAAAAEMGITVAFFDIRRIFRSPESITEEILENNLPSDREKDPVLLYGKLFEGEYEDLMVRQMLDELKDKIQNHNSEEVLIVYGHGALCSTLIDIYQYRTWIDIIPLRAILNVKAGQYKNIGWVDGTEWNFKQAARRCYFVDFELAMRSRMRIFRQYNLDSYIAGSNSDNMTLITVALMKQIFTRGLEYPLRCRPVYLEGVWGGYYVKRLRNLPESMKNCAWVFDMIPMEVSTVFIINGMEFEFPFYALVQAEGEKLMGKASVEYFGNYFPVRFNYDDTFHSNGNMSIQCHPVREYVRRENGEFDRQDESYYVVMADQGAKTYLGFNDGVEISDFVDAVKESERNKTPVDYEKYINAVDSRPGVQVMIPAGTIHASGRNQLILEIGSLTVGSYTYKMYDYLRLDLDGNPRPLHTYHGERVLQPGRTTSWINENVVQKPRIVRSGPDWKEYIVGEHDLLYFSLRNVRFTDSYKDDTAGRFHVLTLVDGEQVTVRSLRDPSRYYVQNYLDIIVVPADMGPYEVVNMYEGTTVAIHKTLLKQGFESEPKD
ncbi:MAG: class I mannose-6-phosphate isomerase [Lachnospiraceae bacterium]|nr:class I mannose-6-phosphate isomerase [Lachnospiraceae bacterium]